MQLTGRFCAIPRQTAVIVLGLGLTIGFLGACGGSSSKQLSDGGVIRVPQDISTIKEAAEKATAGTLILVSPGIYYESVVIKAPHVTLRGLDRNKVIIDGTSDGIPSRANNVILLGEGDAVQNLTVRGAAQNGILITGQTNSSGDAIGRGSAGYSVQDPSKFPALDGFVVDHVTSYNNGLYGIYAFDAKNGVIQNSYTSGHPDSGIYVGQCKPCNISVVGNVAEHNAVGYEGTNASGLVKIYANRFVGNRVGVTTNSDHQEGLVPQDGAELTGNVIADNQYSQTPAQADGGYGIGVGIAGGTNNVVRHNLVTNNSIVGLEITNSDDLFPFGNHILENTFGNNGLDVAYTATGGSGNCLAGNALTTVLPRTLPRTCPATGTTVTAVPPLATQAPPGIPFTQVVPPPSDLPGIPNPATAPAPVLSAALTPNKAPDKTLLQEQSSVRW